MVKIATWNVNSVKARLPHLLRWLGESRPDVVLLQELKATEDAFPADAVGELGYNAAVVGQKTYNGVALLSKSPIEITATALPGDPEDAQARYVEALSGGVRAACLYLPNGNPVDSPKFAYKLSWFERLRAHVRSLLATEDAFVLGGDWNVAPFDDDVYSPAAFADDALCRPESRAAFRRIVHMGLTDAIRVRADHGGQYTWWDYRGGGFGNDEGLRIDHLLLSPQAADRLQDAGIDREPRGWERPSDHTPVWCTLAAAT